MGEGKWRQEDLGNFSGVIGVIIGNKEWPLLPPPLALRCWFCSSPPRSAEITRGRVWHRAAASGFLSDLPKGLGGTKKIAFRDERYERIGTSLDIHSDISNIENNDFQQILKYDTECFGLDRSTFLKEWLQLPESMAFKYLEGAHLLSHEFFKSLSDICRWFLRF